MILVASTYDIQASGQVCVAGVAKLPWKNHVVQNLRAYFILHHIPYNQAPKVFAREY